jgi:hypothetical protein
MLSETSASYLKWLQTSGWGGRQPANTSLQVQKMASNQRLGRQATSEYKFTSSENFLNFSLIFINVIFSFFLALINSGNISDSVLNRKR